ncbi:hypothetical protein EVG20_g3616 [Dentipellis fragilis]|uniref:Microbial-type PARG catalytic domain-containing protein n=1 Tax=Dentipellis fragilis TaxID=205917 RepID=A0A4Y9Z0C3_9AGAM|nr:hypothetical protein EVG20_g3616 [Dentipellis fragilis]
MSSTPEERKHIAEDTIARTPSIVEATPGASDKSWFVPEQLPPLDPSKCPNFPPTPVEVVGTDTFTTARNLMREYPLDGEVAVLNLASDERRAGGWIGWYTRTQEEALCYSSTLYATLREEYYPWPNLGPGSVAGIFSPDIVIFKDDLCNDCVDLPVEERRIVSVITVAGPRKPELTKDGELVKASDLEDFRGKIRLVYRMAATYGKHAVVLGALGCGVYACPGKLVAREMKNVLLEKEFKGWFSHIVFAVYRPPTGSETYDEFEDAFEGVAV